MKVSRLGSLLALLTSLGACAPAQVTRSCHGGLEVVDQIEGELALLNGPEPWQMRWVAAKGLKEGRVLIDGSASEACRLREMQKTRRLRAMVEAKRGEHD